MSSLKINLVVRRATEKDLSAAAKVHELAFPRQTFSKDWIDCVFRAFPKSQLFVAELNGEIVGLIFWTEKSGFRKEAVVELEQIAVHPDYYGKGIGVHLIAQSIIEVAEKIAERDAKLSHVLGNTRANNTALKLYQKLGAQIIGSASAMFTADEVFLIISKLELDQMMTFAKAIKKETFAQNMASYMVLRKIRNFLKIAKNKKSFGLNS